MRRNPETPILPTAKTVATLTCAFVFTLVAAMPGAANAQMTDAADAYGGTEFGSLATSPSTIPMPPPWAFKLDAGWYCDYFDGFFDSDGELQNFNGREKFGMFFLGGHYRVAELGSDDRPIPIIAQTRITYAMFNYSDDDGEFEQSESGLQSLLLGGRTRVNLNETVSASARLNLVLDIGDEEKGLSDGANALVFNVGARKQFGDASVGLDLYRTERLDDRYVETNAFRLRGTYNLLDNDKLNIRGGASVIYQSDTDDRGHALSAGVDARVNFKNSPFALKIDGGCSEDYVPTGNVALTGEQWWQNKSFGIGAYYKL